MIKIFKFLLVAGLGGSLFFFSNCNKGPEDGSLYFSNDTITFDTVFTTLGSTTQYFKVFNSGRRAITINSVQLQGAQFRINVDGLPGNQTNVVIPGRDSIYVFVEVTVNPNSTATPFVIYGDVNFTIGTKVQTVVLQAFGQNAHFHYGEEIKAGQAETWTNDLPHVIISGDSVPGVLVDCGATLTINAGCKVFFAGSSSIFVTGTLNAISHNWNDSIVFEGARLEQEYQNVPGQWFAIVFLRSNFCTAQGAFDHCVINESSYGIYAGAGLSQNLSDYQGAAQQPVVVIRNTIVENTQYNAIDAFNANVTAQNSLFVTAGDVLINIGLGGIYNFTNCTMYNVGSQYVNSQQPVLLLSNLATPDDVNYYLQALTSNFTNCLIYGNQTNEIAFSNIDNVDLSRFQNSFSYCFLQTPADTLAMFTVTNAKNIFNRNPMLKNPSGNDYSPSDSSGYLSTMIDYCPTGLPTDIFDHPRPVSLTTNPYKYDIGCIEVQ